MKDNEIMDLYWKVSDAKRVLSSIMCLHGDKWVDDSVKVSIQNGNYSTQVELMKDEMEIIMGAIIPYLEKKRDNFKVFGDN